MAGCCELCGHPVASLGHKPTCPRGKCRACGGQFPQLSNGLCRKCAKARRQPPAEPPADCVDSDGRAVLLCYSDVASVAMTIWDSLDEALDAAIEFPSCRQDCLGVHDIVTGGRQRVLHAAPEITRRDIRRAMTGDRAAIARLRANLESQGDKHE